MLDSLRPASAEQANVEMIPLKQCAAYLAKEAPNESWDSQFCAGKAPAGVLAGPTTLSGCGARTPPLVFIHTAPPCIALPTKALPLQSAVQA